MCVMCCEFINVHGSLCLLHHPDKKNRTVFGSYVSRNCPSFFVRVMIKTIKQSNNQSIITINQPFLKHQISGIEVLNRLVTADFTEL